MTDPEQAFRDAFARAASRDPATDPIEPEEVSSGAPERSRWRVLAAAAVVAVLAGGAIVASQQLGGPDEQALSAGSASGSATGAHRPTPRPSSTWANTLPADNPIAKAMGRDDAPRRVTDTGGVFSCGQHVVSLGQTLPTEARTCFTDDITRPANMAVAFFSVEGDPIVEFWFRDAGRRTVTRHISTHEDNFGPKGWATMTCEMKLRGQNVEFDACSG
ncbi:hypothetical protein [Aestuariimicrobium ganziense]|uniref:hypothetical protein n=1 Tax=Aestuariimicrobium ganziense TaxID=2773677 RepID=UPI0019451FA9|nr:hypothetical protein [Aestuariimicrobium ganziense]